ncbi:MAG TPA: hypothetical protein VGK73_22940 [Polyangiaceae bacterium]
MLEPNRTRSLLSAVPALIASIVVGGCSAEVSAPEAVTETNEPLYRTGPAWPGGVVNVCIDPADNGGANGPALVAQAQRLLAATWSNYTNLRFQGRSPLGVVQPNWGPCVYGFSETGNYSTIALHFCTGTSTSAWCTRKTSPGSRLFQDYANRTQSAGAYTGRTDNGTGTGSVRHPFGYVAPVEFNEPYNVVKWSPGIVNVGLVGDDLDPFQTVFRHQVIHEFGHALGFAHEQDRPDNNDQCDEITQFPVAGGTPYNPIGGPGLVDNNSIMSYCAKDTLDSSDADLRRPVLLSGVDIWGSRQIYGRRPSAHGFMILSDADPTLAVNAYNGATNGGLLKLHAGCTITNPDCTWSYQRGMLVSDSDPRLAIKRVPTSSGQYVLRLATAALSDSPPGTYACTPENPECTWTYRWGEFLLDADQTYGLNARGGAAHLADVGVSPACTYSNTSCRWTLPNVMLTSDRDSTLPVNAYGGAANQNALKVNQACNTTNGSCTFTFSRGMIIPTGNPGLALTAWNSSSGPTNLGPVRLDSTCRFSTNRCTWQWTRGRIQTDEHMNGRFYLNALNGALDLHDVVLNNQCPATNPDCVFSSFSAKN